jgi:hypothetical protein
VRIAKWAYQNTFDVDGLTWLKGEELVPIESGWEKSLAYLTKCDN